jgi:hypothetical protein
MASDQLQTEQPAPPRPGTLAPIALALGVAGMVLGLVPFYGMLFGLPLSVIALVLGLVARRRPWESRRQAMAGIITASIGLLLMAAWAGALFWNVLGFGQFSSETSMQVGVDEVVVDEVEVHPGPDAEEGPSTPAEDAPPLEVHPTDPGPELRSGLSGDAVFTIDEVTHQLTLEPCALSGGHTRGVLVRGDGPDGRLVVAQPGELGSLLVDLDVIDGPSDVLVGNVHGTSHSGRSGGLVAERHRFEIEGELTNLHDDEPVPVHLEVTCE